MLNRALFFLSYDRRRMEFRSGLNDWNTDLKDNTSLEESSNNDDDPANGPGPADPVQNYDKRELDGIRAAIPFLKGTTHD